jgi:hypothetical protein
MEVSISPFLDEFKVKLSTPVRAHYPFERIDADDRIIKRVFVIRVSPIILFVMSQANPKRPHSIPDVFRCVS